MLFLPSSAAKAGIPLSAPEDYPHPDLCYGTEGSQHGLRYKGRKTGKFMMPVGSLNVSGQ